MREPAPSADTICWPDWCSPGRARNGFYSITSDISANRQLSDLGETASTGLTRNFDSVDAHTAPQGHAVILQSD